MKTLLVEDDADTRDLLMQILTSRGCMVTACADGQSAAMEIQKNSFPLVFLDLQIDGLELCRRIRKLHDGKIAVILVCTGRAFHEDFRAVLNAGADDYIIKPLDPDLLNIRLSIAESLVNQRELRKLAEHKLHALASQLTVVEEQERRRFASELHDGVCQNLGICKIRLCELRARQPNPDPAIEEISATLDRIILETRSLVFEISPPILYEMGLEPALEWLTEHFQERHKLNCLFEYTGSASALPIEVAVTLFQSARELLFNVVKHAKARQATLSVAKGNGVLCIAVADDGQGFDLAASTGRIEKLSGFGIFSIRQRLQFLGGDLKILSDKKRGTRMTMTIPVGQANAKSRKAR